MLSGFAIHSAHQSHAPECEHPGSNRVMRFGRPPCSRKHLARIGRRYSRPLASLSRHPGAGYRNRTGSRPIPGDDGSKPNQRWWRRRESNPQELLAGQFRIPMHIPRGGPARNRTLLRGFGGRVAPRARTRGASYGNRTRLGSWTVISRPSRVTRQRPAAALG